MLIGQDLLPIENPLQDTVLMCGEIELLNKAKNREVARSSAKPELRAMAQGIYKGMCLK